ncbi:hypothetical protein CIHG_06970 [Coccidioides immitis H538.4]|uniref:Uncharacterized protein n=3 Tax=Coccidioides immitis TaxID=5501 RepID=A0A0J8QYQ1_COCIT|nr:hypothetical protein CIRG_10015 [Coccidioides immitis RMSCC 2394]KMU77165.1 hypothetical protein CISG_06202 [Coccidioides immitis RMSCC 3703]KMU78494.1 hypothetical protein CISG_07155 [Coccidioides immitis RMSCC 3703]KMU89298.1 hypothetical protein CIHG_06970 [Coccidioides immitis H538.4]
MASRAFSTSARQMKKLDWKLKGTTVDVTWLMEQINDSVDHVPGLESVLTDASGNPHPTPAKDDPYHGSVELYNHAGQRVTSAHCYPNGYVKFSKKKFQNVKLVPHLKAPVIPPASSKPDSEPVQSGSKSDKK